MGTEFGIYYGGAGNYGENGVIRSADYDRERCFHV